jgi:hypothetical protein
LIRYETQSGFGLSFGPTAATVSIWRFTTGWPLLAFATGGVYVGDPASDVRFET